MDKYMKFALEHHLYYSRVCHLDGLTYVTVHTEKCEYAFYISDAPHSTSLTHVRYPNHERIYGSDEYQRNKAWKFFRDLVLERVNEI